MLGGLAAAVLLFIVGRGSGFLHRDRLCLHFLLWYRIGVNRWERVRQVKTQMRRGAGSIPGRPYWKTGASSG